MVKIATFRWSKWRLFEVSWPLKKPRIPVQQREVKKWHFKHLQTALRIWGRPVFTLAFENWESRIPFPLWTCAQAKACWPVQAPSSLFPFKNEHNFDASGSWNHQGFVHHKGDKENLRNTASKVAFWRVSRNPTNYCPKSMKFGYLFPWKTRGKRVSPRALLKSSKMMSKNHQSGDRRKTNFSTAIMTIIWTPLSL